jgi:RNA polymerase sigma factor (sigma-70 family)
MVMVTASARDDDETLLAAWAAGDRGAGTMLLERHFSSVFRFFRTKLDTGVDELVQRTYEACIKSRASFRGDSTFRAWLLGIARIQILRYLQREHLRVPEDFDPERTTIREAVAVASPSAIVAAREEQRILVDALRAIPLDLQIAIELHYWEDLSMEEIGTVLGIPSGTVKTRLFRARRLLHDAIEVAMRSVTGRAGSSADLEAWVRSLQERLGRGA